MKVWFVRINDHVEGPFSYEDLKKDRRLTPDTLVWKEGFAKWLPIRAVPELQDLFAEEKKPREEIDKKSPISDELIVLEMNRQPPYIFWILIALIVMLYAFIHLYWHS